MDKKKRLIVTGMAAQQIYAQCHDECMELGFFKHDLKMRSKNLVSALERELMPMFGILGSVKGGEAYTNTIKTMESTLNNLATLPVEYWAVIDNGITDVKRQIDEKNKKMDEGNADEHTVSGIPDVGDRADIQPGGEGDTIDKIDESKGDVEGAR